MRFTDDDRQFLRDVLQRARHRPPESWLPWRLEGDTQPLGWMSPERLANFATALPRGLPLERIQDEYVWRAASLEASERSEVLKSIALEFRDAGFIGGWRGESYACWRPRDTRWPYAEPELFRLERAAFRYFGLRSHAAHVHGLTPDGRMWCGRRALSKATDPGLLDNLAAGGIPAGEEPEGSAIREIYEEAGLTRKPGSLLGPRLEVLTERCEVEGWHSERLFVYSIAVGADEHPLNRDGEVAEFTAFDAATVIDLIRRGSFTADAACAIAATFAG